LKGKDEELTSILSKYPFLVNWRNKENNATPLYQALIGNSLNSFNVILGFGAKDLADYKTVGRVV